MGSFLGEAAYGRCFLIIHFKGDSDSGWAQTDETRTLQGKNKKESSTIR